MNFKTFVALGVLATTYSALAMAGVDGGGGMAVVCDQGTPQEQVQLLDLYEAKFIPNIRVMAPTGNLLEDYSRLTNNSLRLQGANYQLPAEEHKLKLRQMMELIDWHEGDQPLPFLNDQGRSPLLPKNCELKQLAIFFDSINRMEVDKKLWEKLDTINQAALLKHESYYWNERKNQEISSETTRAYVRQEASTGFTPSWEGESASRQTCYAFQINGGGNSRFYVHRKIVSPLLEETSFSFTRLSNRNIFVKSTASFKNLIFDIREQMDNQGNPYLVPLSTVVNKTLKVKIESEHRDDLELELKFVANQPIELKVLQNGKEISNVPLRICQTKY